MLTAGRFCPECGALQIAPTKEADPCVGRTIGDRYEIGELIGVGGMGRIHRGLQRSLDRPVAIKFIHPHLMSSEHAVARFMMEARAASRMSHPNVVSIYDFGRTSPEEGGELYLVMELLSGSNLAQVLERESPMPLARVVDILRQTLLALSEAHRRGITHRDVKPENIFLERHHGDIDHVKVIDFGIANMGDQAISPSGQILGTPAYMAPEQVMGEPTGPHTDLYAVGVILFEMVTGKLPFEGSTTTTCFKHTSAPRPDPRDISLYRLVPDELALVCMRAMSIDPAYRPKDAEAFATELISAAERTSWNSLPPPPPPSHASVVMSEALSTRHVMADTLPSINPPPPLGAQTLSLRPMTTPLSLSMALTGRDDVLGFCRAILEEPEGHAALVLWGRTGCGKTRVVHELEPLLSRLGMIHKVLTAAPPLSEVGFSGLRRIIMELSGIPSGDRILALAQAKRGDFSEGLRAIFGSPDQSGGDGAGLPLMPKVLGALAWAAGRAVDRCMGKRVFLVLDDIDGMDGSSLAAVGELLRGDPIPGLFIVATCERCPSSAVEGRVAQRRLRGLYRAEAERAIGRGLDPHELAALGDDIDPLYLEHWLAARAESAEAPPEGLGALIAARIQRLSPGALRTLELLAVTGGGALSTLASMTAFRDDLHAELRTLSEAGLAWTDGNIAALSHMSFGSIVLGASADGAIAELHAAAAKALRGSRDLVELCAYHAIRGEVTIDSFLLIEQAANLRMVRGDVDGAIAALHDAVRAARIQTARGEEDLAGSAWAIFGRKLATALIEAGLFDEAHGVLLETLEASGERDMSRVLVLEQLAMVALHRGRAEEARRRWGEALAIAELRADYALMQRFRRPIPALPVSSRAAPVFQPRSLVTPPVR
jgi:serine/threonine protein kinase/tetratricopeptide (TPR) repeat protein